MGHAVNLLFNCIIKINGGENMTMIEYSTGYIEKTIFVQKPDSEDWRDDGSNLFRSSKGRPYRVLQNQYLLHIFYVVWEHAKEEGFTVGKTIYYFEDSAYNKVIDEMRILPDDFYV